MSGAHTPGPWTWEHPYSTPEWVSIPAGECHSAFDHASLAIGQGDKLLAEVRAQTNATGFPQVECLDEMRANARLMAAAPDMLDALLTVRDYVADAASGGLSYEGSGEGFIAMAKEDLTRIDAAIASARGEA